MFTLLECKKVIHGEGMPTYKNPFVKGDLIVRFNVEFPEDGFATEQQLAVRISIACSNRLIWENIYVATRC